jgi:hypothetical protein
MADPLDALVKGDTGADGEDQDRHHEGPEIHLLAVAEGMSLVGRPAGALQPIEQEGLVPGIDERVYALAQHGRASGIGGRGELGHGDGEIADEGPSRAKLARRLTTARLDLDPPARTKIGSAASHRKDGCR